MKDDAKRLDELEQVIRNTTALWEPENLSADLLWTIGLAREGLTSESAGMCWCEAHQRFVSHDRTERHEKALREIVRRCHCIGLDGMKSHACEHDIAREALGSK